MDQLYILTEIMKYSIDDDHAIKFFTKITQHLEWGIKYEFDCGLIKISTLSTLYFVDIKTGNVYSVLKKTKIGNIFNYK